MVRIGVSMAQEVGHASGLSDVMATGKTAEIQELWPVVAEKKGKNEHLQPFRKPIYQYIYTINSKVSKNPRHE